MGGETSQFGDRCAETYVLGSDLWQATEGKEESNDEQRGQRPRRHVPDPYLRRGRVGNGTARHSAGSTPTWRVAGRPPLIAGE